MERFREKEINSKRIFDGRLLGVRVDTVKLSNGVETTREIVEHPGAVAVIAITDDNKLVLVRQFRRATDRVLLEIPAGVPQKNEKGKETALRELEEETGYRAKKIKKVFSAYASPGYSNERIYYYLAQELTKLHAKPDDDELIEVDLVDVKVGMDMVKKGQLGDNKTIVGIVIAELFLKGEV